MISTDLSIAGRKPSKPHDENRCASDELLVTESKDKTFQNLLPEFSFGGRKPLEQEAFAVCDGEDFNQER